MEKKLIFRTGRYAQVYIAVFASIGVVFVFGVFFVWGLIAGETLIRTIREGLFPIIYPLSGIWLIFFIVAISKRSVIEVTEKGMTKRIKKKVFWHIDWEDVEELTYFRMRLIRILLFSFEEGNLIVTHWNEELYPKKRGSFANVFDNKPALKVNLFPSQVRKIMKEFGKEIKMY